MEHYKAYTILFVSVNAFLIVIAIIYLVFYKSNLEFQISDALGKVFK